MDLIVFVGAVYYYKSFVAFSGTFEAGTSEKSKDALVKNCLKFPY
jgi:hypothetical protein